MNTDKFLASLIKKLYYKLNGYGVNGSLLRVYKNDVFLVGYPKSGNTWLNFLVACLRADQPEDVNFDSIETNVADIYFNNSKKLHGLGGSRCLKSHEPYDARYSKVIYIVRDPRAVAVSYFHHLIGLCQISDDLTLDQFIPGFINGQFDGFGDWGMHVQGWMDAQKQKPDKVMIVKYEDLKIDTEKMLLDIARFMEIETSNKKNNAAILWSSPENMRKLEIEARKLLHPAFDGFQEGAYFVRHASAISWKQDLGDLSERKIIDAWGVIMKELGYI